MNRLTNKQIEDMSDIQLLQMLVNERRNKLSNPNAPLYQRLTRTLRNLNVMNLAYNAPDKGVGEVRSFECKDLVAQMKSDLDDMDGDELGRLVEQFYPVVVIAEETDEDRLQLQVGNESYAWNDVFGEGVKIQSFDPVKD